MALSNGSSAIQPDLNPNFNDPLTLVQSPIQMKPEVAKKSLHGQALWEKSMTDIDLTRRYRKVSVIIIHWEKEENVDIEKAHDEIEGLRRVFENRYNYTVREAVLGRDPKGRSPQAQIQMELANFVWQEDEPQTLLIVYAAGHGIPVHETGKFLLAGDLHPGSDPVTERASDRFNSIVWQEAEALMRGATQADIFLILDCCHAGRLLNSRQRSAWSERIFEFLGACGSDQTTPLPGDESFTAALIWALEQLADADRSFLSAELRDKICEYEHMDQDQLPCLNERGVRSLRKLIIEPLPERCRTEATDACNPATSKPKSIEGSEVRYALKLQFLLPDVPDDDELRRLSGGLKTMIQDGQISAKQVQWKGLFDVEEISAEMARVVDRYATKWQNKVLQKKIKKLSVSQPTMDTSSLTHLGSQQHINGLLTPAPSEITVQDAEERKFQFERAQPSMAKALTQQTPFVLPPQAELQPQFSTVSIVMFRAFILFLAIAICLYLLSLLDMRNLVAKLLVLERSFPRRPSVSPRGRQPM